MSQDYNAVRQAAAWFDQSARAKIRVTGVDARTFLHNLCTNDVKNLPPGAGCEAFFATAQARAVAHGFINCLESDGMEWFRLDFDPGLAEKVVNHLDRFIISEQVELADSTPEFAELHVAGPEAEAVVKKATRNPELPPVELQQLTDGNMQIRKHSLLVAPGYDIICRSDDRVAVVEALRDAGAAFASQDTYNILRIEAGVPIFGVDIDDNRFVVEVGRTKQAISYTKGCYLGQEPIVMARDRGHVNRMLMGLRVHAPSQLPPETKLLRDGKEVGQVTSSAFSPLFGSIALAYIRRGNQEPGTALEFDTAGTRGTAEVASLPFSTT